ncbi:MAG: hypothetical protein A4E58_00296 [Syntrophorhabdus sp. PtaB.Bin006]|nr:MAG: hypothetical protein A4E58_00296 [Syntrophorhabdus sp. PtaB.Bin006]
MVSGYPKQTVVRQGSSVFCCQAKVPKSNASEWSRWSAKNVFVGIFRHDAHPNKIRERNTPFGQQPVDSRTRSAIQTPKIGRKPRRWFAGMIIGRKRGFGCWNVTEEKRLLYQVGFEDAPRRRGGDDVTKPIRGMQDRDTKMNRLSTSLFPNSHKRIGESGLAGNRPRENYKHVYVKGEK